MTIGGVPTPSVVSPPTATKHVEADDVKQEQRARAHHSITTFVRNAAVLTAAVDGDATDFVEELKESDRKDIDATLTITQWVKTNPGAEGLKSEQPVRRDITDEDHLCEIGVKKTGGPNRRLSITHFQKKD